jgi:iron uptake system EfeUOB component EfeO/EfeM
LKLLTAVGVLRTKLASFTFDPNDISLRTHEILEGTARFQLTGLDDYGSRTSLATAADVDGTRTLLKILSPLIEERSKGLTAQLDGQLDTLHDAIEATTSGGRWAAVKDLNLPQRQRINAATGAALEGLSVVPDMLVIPA